MFGFIGKKRIKGWPGLTGRGSLSLFNTAFQRATCQRVLRIRNRMQAFSSICSVLLWMQRAARSQGGTASNTWLSGELGEGSENWFCYFPQRPPTVGQVSGGTFLDQDSWQLVPNLRPSLLTRIFLETRCREDACGCAHVCACMCVCACVCPHMCVEDDNL